MPARETEAIILRTFPLGETDRLVSFFGRASGRMRGVAAGARSVKNRYGSTLGVMSHVQLWYIEKETRELVRIQQAELLESLHKSQSDYALSTGLAVVSEISEAVLPEREVSEAMFRLLLLTAREVERRADWTLPLTYFAFWTVRLGGWLPRFDRCAKCGREFRAENAYAAGWADGLFCGECRTAGMRPLHAEARKLAEDFRITSVDKVELEATTKTAEVELKEICLDWIEHQTEKKLGTRGLLEPT
jgi:DNA repair protein RecO (recombination protein O)